MTDDHNVVRHLGELLDLAFDDRLAADEEGALVAAAESTSPAAGENGCARHVPWILPSA